MAIYRIKRFSFGKKLLKGVTIGAGLGAGLGAPLNDDGDINGLLGGAILGGAIGGLISTGKYLVDKLKNKERESLEKITEDMNKAKASWEKKMYPKKEDEADYEKITALGGMPKEYYQAAEIKKKMAQGEYIKGLNEDQYLIFGIVPLSTFEKFLERDQKDDPAPMIFVGCGAKAHAFCYVNGSWIERNLKGSVKVNNLKSHIINLYKYDIDLFKSVIGTSGSGDKNLDYVLSVLIDCYEYQLNIIKSMPLG
jgi:hypothetical protein